MPTYPGFAISAEAFAEIRRTLELANAVDLDAVKPGGVDAPGPDMVDVHGVTLIASEPNPHQVERHLVQIKIGPDKWIDLFACETPKEAADFMLTVCAGSSVHLRAVHLRSYATAEELGPAAPPELDA